MPELKPTVRCQNDSVHRRGEGNILAVVHKNAVFVQCKDRGCKRWTRIGFDLPGIRLDLTRAGITTRIMPKDHHFDLVKAPLVLESEL